MVTPTEVNDPDFWMHFVLTIMTVPAILLNSILIFVYLANRKYKNTFDMAFLNLALTDAVFAVSGLLKGVGGSLAMSTCSVELYLFNLAIYANMLAVLPISYDRYIAVLYPYRYRKTSHKSILQFLMVLCWAVSCALLGVTVALATDHQPHNNITIPWTFNEQETKCSLVMARSQKHLATVLQSLIYFLFLFLPLIVNIFAYTRIVISLRKTKQKSINPKLILVKAILINFTFTLSWLPYVFTTDFIRVENKQSLAVVRALMYTNSLTDPILYAFSSRAIKLCLVRLDKVTRRSLVRKLSSSFGNTLSSVTISHNTRRAMVFQNSAAILAETPRYAKADGNKSKGRMRGADTNNDHMTADLDTVDLPKD